MVETEASSPWLSRFTSIEPPSEVDVITAVEPSAACSAASVSLGSGVLRNVGIDVFRFAPASGEQNEKCPRCVPTSARLHQGSLSTRSPSLTNVRQSD